MTTTCIWNRCAFCTAESNVTVGGVIERYLQKPVLQISSAGTAALAEIGRVVPALDGYALTPTFDVKGVGPIDRLALDVNVQSQTGNASGKLTADFQSPDLGFNGRARSRSAERRPHPEGAGATNGSDGSREVRSDARLRSRRRPRPGSPARHVSPSRGRAPLRSDTRPPTFTSRVRSRARR